MENEQWPFNGKSLWASLQPGQKFVVIVGVPMFHLMFRAYVGIIDWIFPWLWVRAVFLLIGFFGIPWVYVRGIGIFIAALYQILFVPRK